MRVVTIDGEPWFCAADVCAVLGYANNRDALAKHCRSGGVAKRDTPTSSGNQSMTFINEGNLYRLCIKSHKPEAQKFEAWVCDEVLPAIRKTGAYVAPNAPQATTTPAHVNEPLAANDMNNIKRMVWILSHGFRFDGVWSNGIWFYLRKVLAVPSPQPYCVEHLPRIAHELHTLAVATDKVQTLLISVEQEAARRIFRKGECADLVVADMQRQAFAQLDAMQTQLTALPAYLQKDVAAITLRSPATYDHRNNEQTLGATA